MLSFQLVDRDAVTRALDEIPEVKNWRASAGAIFIVTSQTVSSIDLAPKLGAKIPQARFVMAPISGVASQGRADQATWDFINQPTPASFR